MKDLKQTKLYATCSSTKNLLTETSEVLNDHEERRCGLGPVHDGPRPFLLFHCDLADRRRISLSALQLHLHGLCRSSERVTVSGILSFSWHRSEIAVSRSVTCFWWIKSSRIAQRHPDDLLVARGIERDACFVSAAPTRSHDRTGALGRSSFQP